MKKTLLVKCKIFNFLWLVWVHYLPLDLRLLSTEALKTFDKPGRLNRVHKVCTAKKSFYTMKKPSCELLSKNTILLKVISIWSR